MKNILIISGHTNLAASVANKTILETLNERLPEAEIVKLDELYPDFKIDVEAEQQKLLPNSTGWYIRLWQQAYYSG